MFYAKSDSIESIKEHTDKLLENLEKLKGKYGDKITKVIKIDKKRFWNLMELICKYHDVGKVFSGFQNEIRKKLGLKLLPTKFNNVLIKHEQISPMFIPNKHYNLTLEERKLVYQAIYYHHERDIVHIDINLLNEIIEKDLNPNIDKIKEELQLEIDELKTFYLGLVEGQARIKEGDKIYREYCIMKGLLHRLDHCSSAHLEIEEETNDELSDFIEKIMEEESFKPKDLQQFINKNQDKSLIIVGLTDREKREASLLWSKNDKVFFILPSKTREDCMIEKIKQSNNLHKKITYCTVDQIFPFAFKYKGYEKIYSTLSYSKVIIDDMQAYSPQVVAIILKGLQMINHFSGKFMITTTSLPVIYKEKLKEMGIDFEYKEFIKEETKTELVDKLYKEETLKETKFYQDFRNACAVLNNIVDYDISKKQVQELLKNIENLNTIPNNIYEEYLQ